MWYMSRSQEFHAGRLRMELETPPHPMGEQYDHLMASTLTAYDGDQIVGEVGYGPRHDDKEMAIQGLYVHPEYRGRGIASRLMDHVVSETPKDWVIYHGTQTPDAEKWFAKYSQRPGFDPARHTVAQRRPS